MLKQAGQWLMLGVFVVLQALTPFMHAHASTMQPLPEHGALLHLHLANPAGHDFAESSPGAVLTVAQGVLSRAQPGMPSPPAADTLPDCVQRAQFVPGPSRQRACAATSLPAPPSHCRPPSLAPPAV
ncbi:MAG: hypothetical protein LDL16_03325 [Thiobacillus sp.]|nr:hypothetical protein [Thiobacillus sp.]